MENTENGGIRRKIAIVGGNLGSVWNYEDTENGNTGASEMMFANMARHFQEAGLQVYMIGNHRERVEDDGTLWYNAGEMPAEVAATHFEAVVVCRQWMSSYLSLNRDRMYLVVTDMTAWGDPLPADAFDRVFVMSEWHRRYFQYKYPEIDARILRVAPCAFDKRLYPAVDWDDKENSMVWSSRYERGLSQFVRNILPAILKEIPDFKLYVCQYDNYPAETFDYLRSIQGVELIGRMPRKELHKLMAKSKVWACMNTGWCDVDPDPVAGTPGGYHGGFHETFCSTGIENAMLGNAIFCSGLGGFGSAMLGYAYIINCDNVMMADPEHPDVEMLGLIEQAYLPNVYDTYADLMVKTLKDDDLRRRVAEDARFNAGKYGARETSYAMLVEMEFISAAIPTIPEMPMDPDSAEPAAEAAEDPVQRMLDNETLPGDLLMQSLQ